MNKKKYSKKELKQQLTKQQIEKLNSFVLTLDSSNIQKNLNGWNHARFNKTFLNMNNNISINNLPSNIRIYFPNMKNSHSLNLQPLSTTSSIIPLYLYKNNNIFLKNQMFSIEENIIIEKIIKQLSMYKKLFFLFKARSAKIIN